MPDIVIAAILAILVGLLFLPLHPLANVPMNDDFSWALSAKAFADTGKIVYNGWGNPILLPHIIVGGLLIKLFGFSHIILSAFGIISGMFFAGSVYLLARACKIRRSLAIFAVAITVLNPIFLGCTPSFMSDVPSAFLFTCSLLAFVKALYHPEGEEKRYALRPLPLGIAVVCALLAGANRQLLWAALLLAFAVSFFYLIPGERGKKLVPSLAIIVVFAVGLSLWFRAQPYSVPVSLEGLTFYWGHARDLVFWIPFKFIALVALAVLPVTLPVLILRWKSVPRAAMMLLACLAVGIVPFLVFMVQPNASRQIWNGKWEMNHYGQYVSWQGTEVGGVNGYEDRPAMIPSNVALLLYVIGAVAIGVLLWTIVATTKRRPLASNILLVAALSQIILSLPWFATGAAFDRYLVTLTPMLLIAFLVSAEPPIEELPTTTPTPSPKPYLVGVAFAAVYAVVGICFAQEYFASTQARAALYEMLRDDKHIPPQYIDAGVETLGETQIELEGHINTKSVKNPPDAFQADRKGNCLFAPSHFPAIDAQYFLCSIYPAIDISGADSRDSLTLEPEPVAKADYYSILGPHKRTIYVYRVKKTMIQPL